MASEKYMKRSILESKTFRRKRLLLDELLDNNKAYTFEEVHKIIKNYDNKIKKEWM